MILTRTPDLNSGEFTSQNPKNVSLHKPVIIAMLIRLWWKFFSDIETPDEAKSDGVTAVFF